MKPVHKTMRKQRGAALVEMAMVLPILAVIFMGVVQFGLVLREHQIVQNAAREGARFSMMPQYNISLWDGTGTSPDTTIKNLVVQYLGQENISITTGNVTLDQNYTITVGGMTVKASQVTVSYTRNPIIGGSLFGPFAYKGQAVFRNLY